MGILEGKVVLVTGAAGGIGKECALIAAREGAKVVVIKAAGGEAVANSDSVALKSGAENMIAQALDTFGALHSIISPAGILRDGMFHKMPDEDWDAVLEVHLKGSYNITRAAINHFREQEEGNFVLFTSTSGLIGNIGQANYAAAKMGIAGLSRIIAMEGAAKNVRSNIIAPFAWTRMIATIPVKDEESAKRVERMKNAMRAEQVGNFAVALASPACKASGQIFAVRGNELVLFSQPRPVKSVARIDGWTPETILSHAFPAMEGGYTDLGNTGSVFTWEPV
jgi:NAD(P)-dependent dehydrogenase (short-subunit alcohol dehydrogenase family)